MADAKRFKELVNENGELKKIIADEILKNRGSEERKTPSLPCIPPVSGFRDLSAESKFLAASQPPFLPSLIPRMKPYGDYPPKQTPSSLDVNRHRALRFYSPFIKSKFLAGLMVI